MNNITFLGAGSMAEAIFSGLIRNEFVDAHHITIVNKQNSERLQQMKELYGVNGTHHKREAVAQANILFLAMKPHDLEEALLEIKDDIHEEQLIISVIAGKSIQFIQETLGKKIPIIRSMPNTSATIGLSATAIAKGAFAIESHVNIAKEIFSSIGSVSLVEEEKMHIVTAISGSGPAYFYYIAEAMEEVAIKHGLSESVARELVAQTIIGAGKMIQTSDLSISNLQKNVTSPNGTTEAGIKTLEGYDVQRSIMDCVEHARKRSEELGE